MKVASTRVSPIGPSRCRTGPGPGPRGRPACPTRARPPRPRWLRTRNPRVSPAEDVHQLQPLVGQERLPGPRRRSDDTRVHRDLHLEERVRGRDTPVRAHHQRRPGAQRAERVLHAGTTGPSNGRVSSSICSSSTAQRAAGWPRAKRAEARQVIGMDHLEVRQVRAVSDQPLAAGRPRRRRAPGAPRGRPGHGSAAGSQGRPGGRRPSSSTPGRRSDARGCPSARPWPSR